MIEEESKYEKIKGPDSDGMKEQDEEDDQHVSGNNQIVMSNWTVQRYEV